MAARQTVCKYCNQKIRADAMACPNCGLPGPLKDIENQMRLLVMQGRKVEAMRRVMDVTGWGLRESKDYLDAL